MKFFKNVIVHRKQKVFSINLRLNRKSWEVGFIEPPKKFEPYIQVEGDTATISANQPFEVFTPGSMNFDSEKGKNKYGTTI